MGSEQVVAFTRQRGELQLLHEERNALSSQLATARSQWQESAERLNVSEDERSTQHQRLAGLEQELRRLNAAKYATLTLHHPDYFVQGRSRSAVKRCAAAVQAGGSRTTSHAC